MCVCGRICDVAVVRAECVLIGIIQNLFLNTSMIFRHFSSDTKHEDISDRNPEKEFIIRSFLKAEKTITHRVTYKSDPLQQQCL